MSSNDGKRRVARDSVYDELRAAIVDWNLAPNERLSEEALADRLGVSRTPVREAIQRLEGEQLVVRNAAGLLTVAGASERDAQNVFAVRVALEKSAIRDAVRNVTASELDEMAQTISAMEVAVELNDRRLVTGYGREFHALIHHASHNRIAIAFLYQLQPHVDRYRSLTTGFDKSRSRQALSEHRAIYSALQEGDASKCEDLVANHITAGETVAMRALHSQEGLEVNSSGQIQFRQPS